METASSDYVATVAALGQSQVGFDSVPKQLDTNRALFCRLVAEYMRVLKLALQVSGTCG